ncbi:MAG: succinylglutamate desuccinylase [Brachymonas sp.]|nr:succinylglutamate desuccinylase [Brachymonas sp.]
MPALKPHPVEIERPDLSRWSQSNCGAPRYVHVFQSGSSNVGPRMLISALVHGNEYSGAIALSQLLELLSSGKLALCAGQLTAVFANIDGFHRFDAAQPDASRFVDQDFNRVWSDALLNDNSKTSSELTRAREIRPYVERATHLLDLHSMHEPCEPLLITGLLERNIAFARSLGGVGQVVIDAGHQDGVRMRDSGDFGRPGNPKIALLLEAGQHWQQSSVAASRDAMLRFLLRTGMLSMRDVIEADLQSWLAPNWSSPAPVRVTHAVVAQSLNFEFAGSYIGNEVFEKAGSVIAYDDGKPITTPYDDCILIMPSIRQLRLGVTTARLGQRV